MKDTEEREEDEKSKLKPVSFKSLFRFSTTVDKLLITCGLVAAVIQGTAMPIIILVSGQMTDAFVDYATCYNGGNCSYRDTTASNFTSTEFQKQVSIELEENMTIFAYYYVAVACAVVVCGFLLVQTMLFSSSRQTRKIRQEYFRSILRQEVEWFDNKSVSEFNIRLNEDVSKIGEAIGDKFSYFINNLTTSISALIIGFANGWKLTLIILGIFPIIAGASAVLGKLIASWGQKEMHAYAKAGSIVDNALKNIRTVVAYGAQEKEVNRYYEKLGDAEKQGVRKGVILGAFQGFLWCLLLLAYALAFWYGSVLALDPEVDFSIGRLMTVCFSIMIGTVNLGQALTALETFMTGQIAGAAVFKVIDKNSKIDPTVDDGYLPKNIKGKLGFTDVDFYYKSRSQNQILYKVNTAFYPDRIYALIGTSGSGKTTILKLIQRLHDPCRGRITLDGVDIQEFNVRWLRNSISVVQQEPILFATTILENIRLGCDHATDTDVINAAKAANAHEFIMNLPRKFETLVGASGCQLSGGQKQRIAIARALIRNPRILLMDQACSALDTQSEAIILENLRKMKKNRTIILVAHREATIKLADEVINADTFSISKEINTNKNNDAFTSGHPRPGAKHHNQIGHINGTFKTENENSDDKIENGKSCQSDDTNSECDQLYDTVDYLSTNIDDCETASQNDYKPIAPNKHSGDSCQHMTKYEDTEQLQPISRLLRLNGKEYPYIVLGSVGALLHGAQQPVFAVLLSAIIGVYGLPDRGRKSSLVNFYCIMMTCIAAVSFVANFLQHSMFAKSGKKLTRRIRKTTFSSILRQDMTWFDEKENESATLSSRLSHDAGLIGTAGIQVGLVVSIMSALMIAITIAFYSGWKLALLEIAFFPLLIAAHGAKARMTNASASRDHLALEKAGTIVSETVDSIETVAQLGKEKYFAEKYDTILQDILRNGKKTSIVQGLVFGFASSVLHFSYAATFRFGAHLIGNGEMDFESIFRVFFVVLFAGISLGRAYRHLPDYADARRAAIRIFRLIDRKPCIDVNDESGISPKIFRGDLQLKFCEFTYQTRPNCPVLKNINVEIESGKTLALIGHSGCGKSTIVQILERFYDTDEGVVLLDNEDIRKYNLKYLRSKIGVVFQDPSLFDGTVHDNIAYGDCGHVISLSDVHNAAKLANIHDIIINLEQGYNTEVGCVGNRFSRGQKQRIAIARALVRDPSILLLDEATSSLDNENEKTVQEALERAREGRTTIMIAHRLSTIRHADKIAVISKGEVVECGTHDELIAAEGAYFKMINLNTNMN